MTTGIEPERPAWEAEWAAGLLGVPPGANPSEARAAFLRRLPEVDFVPPPAWRRALGILDGCPAHGPDDPSFYFHEMLAAEDRLRAEVDTFAGRFWALDPAERRRTWNGLSARCSAFPALGSWLERLEPALPVKPVFPVPMDPQVSELLRRTQELYVLRPGEAAREHREYLRQMRRDRGSWRNAVQTLRRVYPDFAALAGPLLSDLESTRKKVKRRRVRKETVGQGSRRSSSAWWAFLLIAMVLGRVASSLSTHSNSSQYPHSLKTSPLWGPNPVLPPLTPQEADKRLEEHWRKHGVRLDKNGQLHFDPVFVPDQDGQRPGSPPTAPGPSRSSGKPISPGPSGGSP